MWHLHSCTSLLLQSRDRCFCCVHSHNGLISSSTCTSSYPILCCTLVCHSVVILSSYLLSSQYLVSGSHDGAVRLWALSLHEQSKAATWQGSGSVGIGQVQGPSVEESKQKAIVQLNDVQSSVLCVSLTPCRALVKSVNNSTGNNHSSSSSGDSGGGLLIAAGANDGTVAMWSANLGPGSHDAGSVKCALLFCHQLRPCER